MRHGCLVLFAICVASCSKYKLHETKTPALDAYGASPRESARVCVVRTSVLASAVTFPTRDNGVLVGATRGRGHFCYLAEPGTHEIETEADEKAHIALNAEAGKTYFLEQGVSNVFGYVTVQLAWIDLEAAHDGLETPYEVLTDTPDDEELPSQPPFAKARR
jgi:hypothetical protein